MIDDHGPMNMPPRWIFLTVAGSPGGPAGSGRRRRRGHLDQVVQRISLDGQGVGQRDRVQDDREPQPSLASTRSRPEAMISSTPVTPWKIAERIDQLVADRCDLAGAEVRVLRLAPGHRAHDRVGERRPEGQDRAHHVQEQE